MEELRNTEALDREILEDARKKADRILRSTTQTMDSIKASWEAKTKQALDELEKQYSQRTVKRSKELMARMPLDKRRARSERAERLLRSTLHSYLDALPREKCLFLLKKEVSSRNSAFEGSKDIQIEGAGLTKVEVQEILKDFLPKDSWRFAQDFGSEKKELWPSLILHTEDVRVSVSLENLGEQLLREKREELARALLGEGAVND